MSVAPEHSTARDGLDQREVVLRFESLGGTGHGCEFGLFQRAYGAEPLGLLRWSDLSCEALVAALDARFEGVGEPEHTNIYIPPGGEEWWTTDRRYWMAMRSFIRVDEAPYERARAMICRRQKFLRRKLIEDLETSNKIFVYKNMMRNLTDTELAALYCASRSYGACSLLYIRYATEDAPAGVVRQVAPGLLVGSMTHFSHSPADEPLEPPYDAFLSLCRGALDVLYGNKPETRAAGNSACDLEVERVGQAIRRETGLRAGAALMRDDRPIEAARLFRQIIGAEPHQPGPYLALADALAAMGDMSACTDAMAGALACTPQDLPLRHRLVGILLEIGQPQRAEQILRGTTSFPSMVLRSHHHHLLGIALEWQGRRAEACDEAMRAAEADPTNRDYVSRATAMHLRIEPAQAELRAT